MQEGILPQFSISLFPSSLLGLWRILITGLVEPCIVYSLPSLDRFRVNCNTMGRNQIGIGFVKALVELKNPKIDCNANFVGGTIHLFSCHSPDDMVETFILVLCVALVAANKFSSPNLSKRGCRTSTTASGKGFSIGLCRFVPSAMSLW